MVSISNFGKVNLPMLENSSKSCMVVSKQCNLQDLLTRSSIPNNIGIFLMNPLTFEDAKQLADSLASLAARIDISQFSLTLSCRCSRDLGSIVTEGLYPMKGLKNIGLVLDTKPGPAAKFARMAIQALQNDQKSTKAVSLMVLPREIRHCIIDYVFNVGHKQQVFIDSRSYGARKFCCRKCMPAGAIELGYCACHELVGGYSTTCLCYRTRLAIFRTNKFLYADSTFVLFSTNRIVVSGLMTAFKFISNLHGDALHAMRMIDIQIDVFEYHLFIKQIPKEFTTIVRIMSENCNLGRLHLSIDAGGSDIELGHLQSNELQQIEMMRRNIVKALMPLKALDRLDVYLSAASPEDEDRMEKLVMGKDYNAIARGKLHMFVRDPLDVHELLPKDGEDESEG